MCGSRRSLNNLVEGNPLSITRRIVDIAAGSGKLGHFFRCVFRPEEHSGEAPSRAVNILYIPYLLFCWIHSLSQSQVWCGTGDKKGGQGQLSEPELLLMALCCESSACRSWCPCVHRNFADETSADGNSCLVKLGEEF